MSESRGLGCVFFSGNVFFGGRLLMGLLGCDIFRVILSYMGVAVILNYHLHVIFMSSLFGLMNRFDF